MVPESTVVEDPEISDAAPEATDTEEPDYAFPGYSVEFSERVALMPFGTPPVS